MGELIFLGLMFGLLHGRTWEVERTAHGPILVTPTKCGRCNQYATAHDGSSHTYAPPVVAPRCVICGLPHVPGTPLCRPYVYGDRR